MKELLPGFFTYIADTPLALSLPMNLIYELLTMLPLGFSVVPPYTIPVGAVLSSAMLYVLD